MVRGTCEIPGTVHLGVKKGPHTPGADGRRASPIEFGHFRRGKTFVEVHSILSPSREYLRTGIFTFQILKASVSYYMFLKSTE